jgi:hypothetical protein
VAIFSHTEPSTYVIFSTDSRNAEKPHDGFWWLPTMSLITSDSTLNLIRVGEYVVRV